MNTWFFLSIIAAFLLGGAQILVKKGLENVSPMWNNVISNTARLIIWLPAVLLLSKFKINRPPLTLLPIIVIAACFYMSFSYAISKGKLALTGTIISMAPVPTIILSNLFLNERLNNLQILGIGAVLLGGVLIALPRKEEVTKPGNLSWIWWGSITALLIGSADFLTKISSNQIGAKSHLFFIVFVYQVLSIANYLVDKSGRKLPRFTKGNFFPTILGNLILWTGSLLFFLSFDYGNVSLIAPIASTYSAITVLLSIILLKERVSLKQGLGIFLAIVGIITIGVGSGL